MQAALNCSASATIGRIDMHKRVGNPPLVDMSQVEVVRGIGKELQHLKCPKCGQMNQELYAGPASKGRAICFTCLKLEQVAQNALGQAIKP